tara:strand:+ start:29154 stop:30134 length:981 start_codon:yes stop_codon:yes gene_type:complete
MRKVFINGIYVDETDAKISIYDSALMFGDMVFEMTRSFNKQQFKLREHIERLYRGLKILRIPELYSIDELMDICDEVQKVNSEFFNDTDEHRLLINISRGPLGIYHRLFDKVEPTVVVADFPLKWTVSGMDELLNPEEGINAVITPQRAIPAELLEPKIKNRSRLFYQMANIEASLIAGRNNWAVLLDPDGFLTEGTGDNIFLVKDNVIYTPEPRNILVGISRNYIFELAKQLNYKVIEKNLETYDAYNCDEFFMTATPFCILPVFKFNGTQISTQIGPITKALHDQWSKNVGLDIWSQIKNFSDECRNETSTAPTPYVFNQETNS